MNTTPLLLALLLLPVLSRAAEEEAAVGKIKRQICSEFPYAPPAKDETEEQGETTPDENVVMLPAYTVSDARLMRDVERAVVKARQELEEKQFDWRNGGTIKEFKRGGRTIEVGIWPNGAASFTLLQIKW